MRVICLLLKEDYERLPELAEAMLTFSPQVALSHEAVFLEVEASQRLFSLEQCLTRIGEILATFALKARVSHANDLPTALAFARHAVSGRERLPVEALSDYLSPFAPTEFSPAPLLRRLGIQSLGEFLAIPIAELPSRFGKDGAHAYGKVIEAKRIAWPRFSPPEKMRETVEFDFAAQIENLEPVFFLLKNLIDRIFIRLYARREKLMGFILQFHLNRLSRQGERERKTTVELPLPQSDPRAVLLFLQERIAKELEKRPLGNALEGMSLEVTETAPFLNAQKDFFSKVEEEKEVWSSLVARLRERLGGESSFLAAPSPRLLPEAAWRKSLEAGRAELMPKVPERPLRLLREPFPLERSGPYLRARRRQWKIISMEGPERLEGEWWLGGFAREYFRVITEEGNQLWVFRDPKEANGALFLHGIYD